jgi:hypothetical protein
MQANPKGKGVVGMEGTGTQGTGDIDQTGDKDN